MITFSGCGVIAGRPDATEALFDSAENAAISQSKLQALVQLSLSVRAQLHLPALHLPGLSRTVDTSLAGFNAQSVTATAHGSDLGRQGRGLATVTVE